jgi:hypothetical protein
MPFAVGLFATLVAFVGLGHGVTLREVFLESGWVAYAVVAVTWLAALILAVLLALSARGVRVPAAVAVGVAALPWVVGAVGVRLGTAEVIAVLRFGGIGPAERASVLARGIAEVSGARWLGAWCASALLGAVGLGLAIAAAAQPATDRKPLWSLAGIALGAPLVGAAVWLLLSQAHGTSAMLVVIAAFGAWLALAIAFGAAAADAPHGRAAALATAAGPAALLAVLSALVASETAGLMHVLKTLAFAEPGHRASVLAVGVAETFGAGGVVRWISLGVGVLGCVALAGYAASRARPSVGRLVGGAALVLVSLLPLGVDRLVDLLAERDAAPLARGTFDEVPGFEPVVLDAGSPTRAPDLFVSVESVRLPDGEVVPHADLASPLGRSRLAAALRVGRRSEDPADRLGALLEAPPEDTGGPFVDGTRRAIALDRRVSGRVLAWIVAAADEAGVTSLELIGATGSVDAAQRALVARRVPLLVGGLETTGCAVAHLAGAFPGAPADADPVLRHGTIGGIARVEVRTRPGAPEDGRTLDGGAASGEAQDRPPTTSDDAFADLLRRSAARDHPEAHRVWLRVGDDATAEALVRVAAAAERDGLRPVLVAGPIPGRPDQPLAPERPAGAGVGLRGPGDLGRTDGRGGRPAEEAGGVTGGAGATVVGALSRDEIRAVVRQASPSVRACYERGLQRSPDLGGRVVVRFVIGPRGAVQSTEVTENETRDDALGACIAGAVRALRFPEPHGGGVVQVSYPFLLQAQ